EARGYTPDEHARGWNLLHAASGYATTPADIGTPVDAKVNEAIATLDAWDEDGFRIVRAALTYRHPDQAKRVLEGIGPSIGPAAVVGVKTLLDRLDALEEGKDSGDKAALKTLAARRLSSEERGRLRELVDIAEKGT